jgi:HTH-type transcriptional regulator/antitoxin HipB
MLPIGYSEDAVQEAPAMKIRTATDLGAFIRERRIKLGMDQSDLAEKAGTSRKWIIEVEQGKPRAEIGLVLRTLKTLGVFLDIAVDRTEKVSPASESGNVDINNILNSLKKRP